MNKYAMLIRHIQDTGTVLIEELTTEVLKKYQNSGCNREFHKLQALFNA